MKKWLALMLNGFVDKVAHLGHSAEELAEARRWADWMKGQWAARGLVELPQQKNPMTEARAFLKQQLGEEHVALAVLNFSTDEWRQINDVQSDRVDERAAKLLDRPDQIVEQATWLLGSHDWTEIAAGLAVVTGRRLSELLSTMRLMPMTAYSVRFSGALKRRGEKTELTFEMPTLCPADRVLTALDRLRGLVDAQGLTPEQINARYSQPVTRAVERHFAGLVPPREGHDSLYTHLQRAVYAAIATYYYCPPNVPTWRFKALVQGHFQVLEAPDEPTRLAYTARRHYDDYEIGDGNGHALGRRGIHLGQPGVELLEALRTGQTAITEVRNVDEKDSQTVATQLAAAQDIDQLAAGESEDQPQAQPLSDSEGDSVQREHTTVTGDDQGQTGSDPITTRAVGSTAPKKRRAKAITYRVWPADRDYLEALRSQLGSDATQADGVAHLVALATAGKLAADRLGVQPDQLAQRSQELTEQLAARQYHLQARDQQIAQLRQEVAGLHQQIGALQARLEAQQHAATGGSALGNLGQGLELQSALIGFAHYAIDLARAIGAAGVPSAVPATPAAAATAAAAATTAPRPPVARVGLTPTRPQQAAPATTAPTTAEAHADEREAAAQRSTSVPSAEVTIQPDTPVAGADPHTDLSEGQVRSRSGRPNSAEVAIDAAVRAIIAFNEQQARREDKWGISKNAVKRLTGSNWKALDRYFVSHDHEIQAHNRQHGLTDRHNTSKGKLGFDIKQQVQVQPEREQVDV